MTKKDISACLRGISNNRYSIEVYMTMNKNNF